MNNETKYMPANYSGIKCVAATQKSPAQWNQMRTQRHPLDPGGGGGGQKTSVTSCETPFSRTLNAGYRLQAAGCKWFILIEKRRMQGEVPQLEHVCQTPRVTSA